MKVIVIAGFHLNGVFDATFCNKAGYSLPNVKEEKKT